MNATADSLAIDLRNVTKVYAKGVHALKGISLSVGRGEIFGLLGPNGAGKTTLIKIMMTVVRPTEVQGTLLGKPVGDKPTLEKVGYLPEKHRFPRYLTGRQTLDFFAGLCGIDRATRKRRAAELIELVGMTRWADVNVSTYSNGMMQRIGLAQAMVNDPDLILLDEPTDGVDPMGRRDIRDALLRLRSLGKTVFINSHLLSELEMVTDRVAILVGGRVARQGTVKDLSAAQQRYEIDISGTEAGEAGILAILSGIGASFPPAEPGRGTLSSGISIELHDHTIRVGTSDEEQIQIVFDALRKHGLSIKRVQVVRPSLEDLFIEAVNDTAAARKSA
jgi:ABC-2 type transport system ATP-binding protein